MGGKQSKTAKRRRPKSKKRHRENRESNTCPSEVGSILEGVDDQDQSRNPTVYSSEAIISPKSNATTVRYNIALVALMLISIALVAGATYSEVIAYFADKEWNDILENKHSFPKSVPGDKFFRGKTLEETSLIPVPEVDISKVKMFLMRPVELEMIFLIVSLAFILIALVHILLFLLWYKYRQKLKIAYLGFGFMGLVLFVIGVMLVSSVFGHVPTGFLQVRKLLEDEVGHPNKSPQQTDIKPRHSHGNHADHVNKEVNCVIHHHGYYASKRESLERLLTMSRMCAYRYVYVNYKDECKKHVDLPEKLKIKMPGTNDTRQYSIEDLADVRFCPLDGHKIIALILVYSAAVLCWIIMWVGSIAEKKIFKPQVDHGHLVWSPESVTAIEGWSVRTNMPSYMKIEMSNGMRSSEVDWTIPETSGTSRKIATQSNVNIASSSIGSIASTSPSGILRHGAGAPAESHPGQPSRPHPLSGPQRPTNPEPFGLASASIMVIAPGMVIHPPTRPSNPPGHDRQHHDEKNTWFNEYE